MYNNVYQEYINNMISTMPRSQHDFEYTTYRDANYTQNAANIELEKFYPHLYKLLYPMIQAACIRNTKPITEETIDEMTRDIYCSFNADDITTNDVRSGQTSNMPKTAPKNSSLEKRNTEERNFSPHNYVLKDLIRILIIRELLGRPGNISPFRQGFPGTPPFAQREIGLDRQNYDIYEYFYF